MIENFKLKFTNSHGIKLASNATQLPKGSIMLHASEWHGNRRGKQSAR
jgi:hypothetical protein